MEEVVFILLSKCASAGYHPRLVWRSAIAIALRKSGKDNYSLPRSYRLIQLLECLGKVLESIQASRVSYLVKKFEMVPGYQKRNFNLGCCPHVHP